MTTPNPIHTDPHFMKNAIEAAIRIGLLILLVGWCFRIVQPFAIPIIWGMIIAVAIHPLYRRLRLAMGDRRNLAATLVTLLGLALIIIPSIMLAESMVKTTQALATGFQDGTLKIPPPRESVASWPFVGSKLFDIWSLAATNLEAALERLGPQIKAVGGWLFDTAASAGFGILQFIVSIIIAGVLLAHAKPGREVSVSIASRLAGDKGPAMADMAGATVRSVAQGVLGVALIQALAAGIGMLVLDVPGAGIWALLVLLLAVVQLPPLLVLGPVAIWVFSAYDTVPAVIFLVWAILVGVSDTFLKPLFLGRGVDVPMLVVLLGAIGGMLLSGIIGLFVGAVVLALGFQLFITWLSENRRESIVTESGD